MFLIFTCEFSLHFCSHDVIFLCFDFQDTTWWKSPIFLYVMISTRNFSRDVQIFIGLLCVFLSVSTQKARTVWKQRKTSHVCSRLRLPHLSVRKQNTVSHTILNHNNVLLSDSHSTRSCFVVYYMSHVLLFICICIRVYFNVITNHINLYFGQIKNMNRDFSQELHELQKKYKNFAL